MALVILTGAWGSGKTTIAEAVAGRYPDDLDVLHFDRIGVPAIEEMIAEYGSGGEWQRAKTIEWMVRLAALRTPGRRILFEGQTCFSFLAQAASLAGGVAYTPILVDCDDDTRRKRPSINRRQPDLANARMMNWAACLRREATRQGHAILDTLRLSLDESVAWVCALLEAQRNA